MNKMHTFVCFFNHTVALFSVFISILLMNPIELLYGRFLILLPLQYGPEKNPVMWPNNPTPHRE